MMKKILFLSVMLFLIGHETNRCLAQSWDKKTPKPNKAILKIDSTRIDQIISKSDSLKPHSDTLVQSRDLIQDKIDSGKNVSYDYIRRLNSEYVNLLYYPKTVKANQKINYNVNKRSASSMSRPFYSGSSRSTNKNRYQFPVASHSSQISPSYYIPQANISSASSKKKKQEERKGYVTSKKIINKATKDIGNYQSPYQYGAPILWQQSRKRSCFSCFGSGKNRDFYGNIYPCSSCKGKGKL